MSKFRQSNQLLSKTRQTATRAHFLPQVLLKYLGFARVFVLYNELIQLDDCMKSFNALFSLVLVLLLIIQLNSNKIPDCNSQNSKSSLSSNENKRYKHMNNTYGLGL